MGNSLKIPIGTFFLQPLQLTASFVAAVQKINDCEEIQYVFPFEGMAYFRYPRVEGVYQKKTKCSLRVLL